MSEMNDRHRANSVAARELSVTVVICTYTDRRWNEFVAAMASLAAQRDRPEAIVVVVDYNDALLNRVRACFSEIALVVANEERRGLAGARNTGIRYAEGDVVAFLDDDAEAEPDWLGAMVAHFAEERVVGVGGVAKPVWPSGSRPRWFPVEFDWVVGCSHKGLPEIASPVRNLLGATMSIRRSLFDQIGGFDTDMGRTATFPLGAEETELAVRARRNLPDIEFILEPSAVVHHHVASDRPKVRYYIRRCFAEGLSKAALTERSSTGAALSTERRYVKITLPRGMFAGMAASLKGDPWGVARAAMIVFGLLVTTTGYGVGRLYARASVFRSATS